MNKIDLTKDELSQLIGGVKQLSSLISDDVDNTNDTAGCICTYNNHSAINNNNGVKDCRCKCI